MTDILDPNNVTPQQRIVNKKTIGIQAIVPATCSTPDTREIFFNGNRGAATSNYATRPLLGKHEVQGRRVQRPRSRAGPAIVWSKLALSSNGPRPNARHPRAKGSIW